MPRPRVTAVSAERRVRDALNYEIPAESAGTAAAVRKWLRERFREELPRCWGTRLVDRDAIVREFRASFAADQRWRRLVARANRLEWREYQHGQRVRVSAYFIAGGRQRVVPGFVGTVERRKHSNMLRIRFVNPSLVPRLVPISSLLGCLGRLQWPAWNGRGGATFRCHRIENTLKIRRLPPALKHMTSYFSLPGPLWWLRPRIMMLWSPWVNNHLVSNAPVLFVVETPTIAQVKSELRALFASLNRKAARALGTAAAASALALAARDGMWRPLVGSFVLPSVERRPRLQRLYEEKMEQQQQHQKEKKIRASCCKASKLKAKSKQ